MEELCSDMGAVLRTHASIAAAADALKVSLHAVYGGLAEGEALASGIVLAWSTYDCAEYGTWKPVIRADVLAAAGKSAPEAPAAGVRPYPPPPAALPDCLPAKRCVPFA